MTGPIRRRRATMFAAAAALAAPALADAAQIVSEPFLGVRHFQITETTPRPLFINVLEIALDTPGLAFRHSPPDPDPPLRNGVPDETITQMTRDFVDEQGAQIGINTSFFRLEHHSQARWTNNVGLATSDGNLYSPWDADTEFALNITSDNDARILNAPDGSAGTFDTGIAGLELYNAVRGSHRIVSAGNNAAPARSDVSSSLAFVHPRTAAGVNQGRTKLLLFTVDGRQDGFSEGMYLDELADLMLSFGVRNGINLDGGGSTTLAFDYYGDTAAGGAAADARLVNSPVGRGPPGSERFNGASLAVFAALNPAFTAPALPEPPPPPPPGVTILEDFETGEGRFFGTHTSSGSSEDVGDSTIVRSIVEQFRGVASQEITLTYQDDGDDRDTFRIRHLSNGGNPATDQVPITKAGFIGYWLKVGTEGLSAGDAQASLIIDDGPAHEQAEFIDVIADGQWHLYEWDLADADDWAAFAGAGADGEISQASVTLDSIFLNFPRRADVTVYWDALAWNADGSLVALVPEPWALSIIAGAAILLIRRRRGLEGHGSPRGMGILPMHPRVATEASAKPR